MKQEQVIERVKHWLENVIIKFNFCPFAKNEFINQTIQYSVSKACDLESRLSCLEKQFLLLDGDKRLETTLIIYPQHLESFFDYIDFLEFANELLVQLSYEGTYQLASFHPDYCFDGVKQNDPSNFTNRSPFPMIHILREETLEKVLENFENSEQIPDRNIAFTKAKGCKFFESVLNESLKGQNGKLD